MKKLLSLLGAVLISASTSTAVVSCSYDNNLSKNYKNEVSITTDVSSYALRSAILADQNFGDIQNGNPKGIDLNFATNYFGNASIQSAMPEIFKSNQAGRFISSSTMWDLYRSIFGAAQGGSGQGNDSYNLLLGKQYLGQNAINPNTRLANMVNEFNSNNSDPRSDETSQPDSSISSLINLIAGGGSIVFANDLNPTLGGTLIGLLSSATLQKAITTSDNGGDGYRSIFDKLDDIISGNQEGFTQILNAITQNTKINNIDVKNANYSSMLNVASQKLAEGVIYFATGQKYAYDGADAGQVLFDYLFNKNTEKLKHADSGMNTLLTQVANIAFFGVTLLHYISAFDDLKNRSYPVPIDGAHLFKPDESNGDVIKQILNKPYVDQIYKKPTNSGRVTNEVSWYPDDQTNDGSYNIAFNFKNLVSDIQYYLSPSSLDSRGFNTLKLFNIILGNSSDGENPFVSYFVESSLLPSLTNLLNNVIPNVPVVKQKILDLFGNGKTVDLFIQDIINWLVSNGDGQSNIGKDLLEPVINGANLILSLLNPIVKYWPAAQNIINIVNPIVSFLNKNSLLMEHPWQFIYSGDFFGQITELISNVDENAPEDMLRIFKNIRNIKNLLTGKLSSLINGVSSLQLPDWLYSAKDLSIANVADWLASEANTNRYNTREENSSYTPKDLKDATYIINTTDLKTLVSSLFASDDPNNRVYFKDTTGKVTNVSLFEPLYSAMAKDYNPSVKVTYKGVEGTYYFSSNNDYYKLPNQNGNGANSSDQGIVDKPIVSNTDVDENALYYLLGLANDKNGVKQFVKGTPLYALGRLYGHDYPDGDSHEELSHSISKLFGIFSSFGGFTSNSINNLINDKYKKYMDASNFKVYDVSSENFGVQLDINSNASATNQYISYKLSYKNIYDGKTYIYDVKMQRNMDPWGDESSTNVLGWQVTKFYREN